MGNTKTGNMILSTINSWVLIIEFSYVDVSDNEMTKYTGMQFTIKHPN